MKKIDLKKELKTFYHPSTKKVSIVDIPPMNYLMIDGKGDPANSAEYPAAIEALYPLAYTLKFMLKGSDLGLDYVVMPLEGLWWAENIDAFKANRRDEWLWTSMIMLPPEISQAMVNEAITAVRQKNNPAALDKVRFEPLHEGLAVQIMYIGPYANEGPTIEKLHQFMADNGYTHRGKHHEIYLSDPRRTAPEKLKSVIRHPVRE
jgi:hypothetical protein